MDPQLVIEAYRQILRAFDRWRYGSARELKLFCYESHVIDMTDPDDPDFVRLLSDRALHWWLGKATDPTSRSILEREVRRREARPAYWVGLAAVLISAIALIGTLMPLVNRDPANSRRCLAIQRDMLSSMPLRSDDPDLFQALGCRPQGDGSVYAERDTKDDADAAIEQSARRRALPYRSLYHSGSQSAVLK